MTPISSKSARIYHILFLIVLAVGIGLRIYQHFFSGRPLWEDEAHLALNFINSGYIEMFMPLQNFQSAPIVFLLGVETFSKIFGFGEVALRSFPFLIAISCYPLFYYFVRDMTGSRLTALVAFVLLTFNLYNIQYSSELKPYIVELSMYILLGFLVFSKSTYVAKQRDKLLKIAGCTVLFLANTSFIIVTAVAIYRWWTTHIMKKAEDAAYSTQKKSDGKLFKAWGIAFAAMIILNIIINPYADNMLVEWKHMFIPVNVFSSAFVSFMQIQLHDTFYLSVFRFPTEGVLGYLPPILMIAGLMYMLWAKKYSWIIFSVLPVLAHCFLSWMQLYPLFQRFVLYLQPGIIIWMAIAVSFIAEQVARVTHAAFGWVIALLFLGVSLAPSVEHFPLVSRDIKPCLDYINNQPLDKKLFTTTPKTLYEYYYKTGYAKNPTREEVRWNITPAQYLDSVSWQRTPYMLLHSRYNYDGYAPIIKTLDSMGLITYTMEYSDYRLIVVEPAP